MAQGKVGKPLGLKCMDTGRIARRQAEMRERMARRPMNEDERRERNRESCRAYYRRRVAANPLPIDPEIAEYLEFREIECNGGPLVTNMGSTLSASHSLSLPGAEHWQMSDHDLLRSLRGTGYHL